MTQNVWTVYACGIHAGPGLNTGKPCPACRRNRRLEQPPADEAEALREAVATLVAVNAYAAAKRGASFRARSPEEALNLSRQALRHIEEECDRVAARVAQFVTDPGGQS